MKIPIFQGIHIQKKYFSSKIYLNIYFTTLHVWSIAWKSHEVGSGNTL